MSHDKIRRAARKRMARTGEPYVVARREVMNAAKGQAESTRMNPTTSSYAQAAAAAAVAATNRSGIAKIAADVARMNHLVNRISGMPWYRDSWSSS